MRLVKDIVFQIGTELDKNSLKALSPHPDLIAGTHCVYIYSLSDSEVPYPKENGSIVYIGEVSRVSTPSGSRFSGHISKSLYEGNNFTTNHTLTAYYYGGHKLRLQIYRLDNCDSRKYRKQKEKNLIAAHVRRFGAQPIGQGTTGPSYTPDAFSKLIFLEEEIEAINTTIKLSKSKILSDLK